MGLFILSEDQRDNIGYDGLAAPMTLWGTYNKPKEPIRLVRKNSGIGRVILGVATAAMLLRRR